MTIRIPKHLQKYIVKQHYNNYTYIDQSCWKFIMKISVSFFKKHADKIYIEGLKKTGITINRIPKIENINKKLSVFGWRAVCVRGFIPPQAFMEFQSLRILPIAADMRDHRNLTYTPAPDIVHEAAGHAPIIANKDYRNYLIKYGKLSVKAIISSEDMKLYYAIRDLSDIKANKEASKNEIKNCEKNLKNAYQNISYISESAMLSRMNWWTVEYGLVGNINKPKIYGAGLLSSVSESENCLTKKVKKISLNLDCINYNYDITEQQPQLFVTPNYNHLTKTLNKLSEKMSYKVGGMHGIKTAIKAQTLCTIEFENNIQISGIVTQFINIKQTINFIKLVGPVQISYNNQQIKNHGSEYHTDGYSTPIGNILPYKKPISKLSQIERTKLNIKKNKLINLTFDNNILIKGRIINIIKKNNSIIMISLKNCLVTSNQKILFNPKWGIYDLICVEKIISVYGGPADTKNYYLNYKSENSKYSKYRKAKRHKENNELNKLFKKIDSFHKNEIDECYKVYQLMKKRKINDWLLKYKLLDATNCNLKIVWIKKIYTELKLLSNKNTDLSRAIKRGLKLFN